MCEKEQEIISPSSPLDSIRVVWGTHVLYLCSQPSTVQPDCQSPERTRIGRSVPGTYFLSQMRAFTLVCTCDRCESIWRHSLNLQQRLLVQENAWPHVARVCCQFLDDKSLDAIDWPSWSFDPNPTEHLLNMSHCIQCHRVASQAVYELSGALI